jgi:hypothetical protein
MANNSLPLTPTQNTDGTYSVKLASVTSEQDISIALDEMIFVFNFAGYGTDELKSVTVNGSEIGEDGYIFTALESETYYTFKGWTCALLGLDSVNSISWTKLNDMSVAEYTFTSVWTFNSEKVQEMYKTAFTVSREKNSDDNKEKIIAQVKYDKTLMAELEKEMAAHGDSILATGYINYKVDDLDKIDEIARLPWVSLATEELSEAQEQKLLYQFSFKNSPNKAQLKMWSYMSGLSMDRWTITGMEETDKRSIYAYIVLKVDGEVVYVLSDLIEAKIETETASDASDGENDGVQNGTSGVVEESSGSSDSTGSTGSTGSTESENNGEE